MQSASPVDCDEELPKCTLCKRRKLECNYPPDPDSPNSPSVRDGSDSGPRTPGGDLPLPTRMLEMRLFHQYLTSTYLTLSRDGLSGYHLYITIPKMAASNPFLLDSILALSALHLASIEVDNRQSWLEAAMRYQSQTCAGLGKSLPEITYQQYEPAFVASVFILLYAQGFPVISSDSPSADAFSRVLEVRTLISGSAMFFTKLTELGIESQLDGGLCPPDAEENLEPPSLCGDIQLEGRERLFDLHKEIMKSLGKLRTTLEADTSPNGALYIATLQILQYAIEPWPKIGAHGGVIAWPLFLAEEFITLVQDGDWTARILFLHYATAMRLLCNRWYVRDWGRRLVLATVQPLEEIPPMWKDTISWMMQGIGIDHGPLAHRNIKSE
ncbi:uncharacterized protein N7484_001859 [Penicillium longicatenatum]|uniref:uncharacterized protein n=1 Tax=Penicillium longicatenatum TaxID=1561947 RepID=UPI002548505C|nr:uncharacterized protein N7484_001859 [Penicillium longicatenatum]KAJ5658210.1 hypothetical protein N7484_001859 [Penicillium longicatenatum]